MKGLSPACGKEKPVVRVTQPCRTTGSSGLLPSLTALHPAPHQDKVCRTRGPGTWWQRSISEQQEFGFMISALGKGLAIAAKHPREQHPRPGAPAPGAGRDPALLLPLPVGFGAAHRAPGSC